MSATGRGIERQDNDNYPTPMPFALSVFPALPTVGRDVARVLDPCCGAGNILRAAQSFGHEVSGIEIDGDLAVEASRSGFSVVCADALEASWPECDFIVTNPPFVFAEAFLLKAIDHIRSCNGVGAALLLRMGFLGSAGRSLLFKKIGMPHAHVLSPRPQFAMSCKCKYCGHKWYLPIESPRPKDCPNCSMKELSISCSDSAEYAWMVWSPYVREGRLSRLDVAIQKRGKQKVEVAA